MKSWDVVVVFKVNSTDDITWKRITTENTFESIFIDDLNTDPKLT